MRHTGAAGRQVYFATRRKAGQRTRSECYQTDLYALRGNTRANLTCAEACWSLDAHAATRNRSVHAPGEAIRRPPYVPGANLMLPVRAWLLNSRFPCDVMI
jgi:hypothetical protein